VGIDTVVTLHRMFDAKRLIAEDSFFVQIKSASVDSIEYTGAEVKWLYELDLPIFFGSVDAEKNEMSLFCAQQLAEAFITKHDRQQLSVHFDGAPDSHDVVDTDDVHIGPPVFKWDLESCGTNKQAVRQRFYEVVKPHVGIQKENLRHRSIGWVVNVDWKTNEPPAQFAFKTVGARPPDEMLAVAYNAMMPPFVVWQGELVRSGNWEAAADVVSLLEKARKAIAALEAGRVLPAKELNGRPSSYRWLPSPRRRCRLSEAGTDTRHGSKRQPAAQHPFVAASRFP
jgi:hypothetical protein